MNRLELGDSLFRGHRFRISLYLPNIGFLCLHDQVFDLDLLNLTLTLVSLTLSLADDL